MPHDSASTTSAPAHLRKPLVLFMSLAAAVGTSTIYPMQPAIADVAASLGSSVAAVGIALACGPIGYIIGLSLLVPLVDRFAPRRLLAAQFAVLAAALATSAVVGNAALLGVAVGVVGACSAVGAGLSSIAGRLAAPQRRAATLGVVTAGISAGILAGRIVGGWLADQIGWRNMLLLFAAACAVIAVACFAALPTARGNPASSYLSTLRSLPGLIARHVTLRAAAVRGALWFFAFCATWAGLAVALSEPPYSYSAEQIGLYALAGLSGILITPFAGTLTDRVGARRVILCGLVIAGLAAVAAGLTLGTTAGTLVCLALFDAGLFAAQVANQSTILAIDPSAPARYNSAYMVVYFVGGSLGTALGAVAADGLGWAATAGIAAASIGAAGVLVISTRQPSMRTPAAARATP